MQTYQQTIPARFQRTHKQQPAIYRFFTWAEKQEPNRFGWLAVIIALQACLVVPVSLLFVFAAGNALLHWAMITGAMAMCLVTNLAAMPTKITIPVFILSLLIDIAVVAMCLQSIWF